MVGKIKIQKAGNIDVSYPAVSQDNPWGVVGGADGLGAVSGGNTIACTANICTATGYFSGPAYIVDQRGDHLYAVANIQYPQQQAVCYLSPDADNLPAQYMNITAYREDGSNISLFYITNKHAYGFPPDYSNIHSTGTVALAENYLVSFVRADADTDPETVLVRNF